MILLQWIFPAFPLNFWMNNSVLRITLRIRFILWTLILRRICIRTRFIRRLLYTQLLICWVLYCTCSFSYRSRLDLGLGGLVFLSYRCCVQSFRKPISVFSNRGIFVKAPSFWKSNFCEATPTTSRLTANARTRPRVNALAQDFSTWLRQRASLPQYEHIQSSLLKPLTASFTSSSSKFHHTMNIFSRDAIKSKPVCYITSIMTSLRFE